MNFLELVRMTVQQSGTVQGILPGTVIGQSGRLKQFVDFVAEAYVDIQNAHRMWRWLQGRFVGQTVAGTPDYAATSFNDELSGAKISRFSQWGFSERGGDTSLSMYLTSAGNAEEGPLRWFSWDEFYETKMRGPQTPGKPQIYSVTDGNRLILSPTPDAVYTLRGKYRKSAQRLVLDSDIPEMPVDFHTIIKDAALQYIEGFDEGTRIPVVRLRLLPNWSMLEGHQLPKMTWGAPLA